MAQSDAWTRHFYAFLHRSPALWREPALPDEHPGPARATPIIRLEDGSHVTPFDSEGRPAAYLPGPAVTGVPTVRRAVADFPAARQFLEALRFTEPDVVAEVLESILPRYNGLELADLDAAQHDADLECVVRALAEAAAGRRQRLLEQLQETAFLIGENAATGQKHLMTPASLYQRTKELEIYFDGNPDTWFADDAYGPWLVQLRGMGVRENVALRTRAANQLGYVVIADEFARHERGIEGFDPGAEVDGLDFALRHPSHARSEYVWNVLLAPNWHLVAGVVEKSVRQEFADSGRENVTSAIGLAATGAAWLPGPDGTFHRPAELSLDDLPLTYKRDEMLAKALRMTQPAVAEASRQLGVPPEVLWGLSAYPDLVATIQRELKTRSAASQSPEADQTDPDAGLRAERELPAGEKEHVPGLDLAWLVEEGREGAGDGCGEGAVLGEGLGRDEDQAGVGLAGGAVAGVQRHEVLDVGGDQGAAGRGRMGQDLVVDQPDERWFGYDGQHIMAFCTQVLGDAAREHLI